MAPIFYPVTLGLQKIGEKNFGAKNLGTRMGGAISDLAPNF